MRRWHFGALKERNTDSCKGRCYGSGDWEKAPITLVRNCIAGVLRLVMTCNSLINSNNLASDCCSAAGAIMARTSDRPSNPALLYPDLAIQFLTRVIRDLLGRKIVEMAIGLGLGLGLGFRVPCHFVERGASVCGGRVDALACP